MNAADILKKAAGHMADRAATYDKPEGERSMGRAVEAFNAITGRDLSESEGWLLLQVLKSARLFTRPGYHADSAEDSVAYAALVAEAKSVEAVSEAWPSDESNLTKTKCEGRISQLPTIDSGPMWVEWRGGSGEPPVRAGEAVGVRLRNGDTEIAPAGDFAWKHVGSDYDIVAWREPWPEDTRIDTIGQNGDDGNHYYKKPSWEDAPEWAKWLAQDECGLWFWYEVEKVECLDNEWIEIGNERLKKAGEGLKNPDWRLTLEARPI